MYNKEDGSYIYIVTKEQIEQGEIWKKTLPKIKKGKLHPGFSYVFSHSSGIGLSVEIVRNDKPKKYRLNLTDYSTW